MIDRRPAPAGVAPYRAADRARRASCSALVGAACGGNRSTAKPPSTTRARPAGGRRLDGIRDRHVDVSGRRTTPTGVSGNTITIGTSLPESGPYPPFTAILDGEQAYIDYTNANGGVERRRQEVPDQARRQGRRSTSRRRRSRTCSRCLTDNNMFALFNVVGTKNNLGDPQHGEPRVRARPLRRERRDPVGQPPVPVADRLRAGAVPARGARRFVDYLKKTKPDATIAVLQRQRRLRAVVRRHADPAREGHEAEGRADPAVRQRRVPT